MPGTWGCPGILTSLLPPGLPGSLRGVPEASWCVCGHSPEGPLSGLDRESPREEWHSQSVPHSVGHLVPPPPGLAGEALWAVLLDPLTLRMACGRLSPVLRVGRGDSPACHHWNLPQHMNLRWKGVPTGWAGYAPSVRPEDASFPALRVDQQLRRLRAGP